MVIGCWQPTFELYALGNTLHDSNRYFSVTIRFLAVFARVMHSDVEFLTHRLPCRRISHPDAIIVSLDDRTEVPTIYFIDLIFPHLGYPNSKVVYKVIFELNRKGLDVFRSSIPHDCIVLRTIVGSHVDSQRVHVPEITHSRLDEFVDNTEDVSHGAFDQSTPSALLARSYVTVPLVKLISREASELFAWQVLLHSSFVSVASTPAHDYL